jgi:DNA polymerase-4
MRWVIHLDMDAYFASIEQLVNPALRGKPVIVGGELGTRSTVATASYEARTYGVRSGMSVAEAHRLCPHGIFVPGSSALYVHTSARIFRELGVFSPRVEPASIDEAYLELDSDGDVCDLGRRIQAHVEATFGLTASLGISDSKYLAKVCSSFAKPRGLTLLRRADVERVLWPMSVSTLYGVGDKTALRLAVLGYRTVGDVARAPAGVLRRQMGVAGEKLWTNARGEDALRVTPPEEAPDAKSIGHEHTLERDAYDRSHVEAMLYYLAEKVGRRARRAEMAGRRVVLKLRDRQFRTITHGRILSAPIDSDEALFRVGCSLLEETRFWERGVRLLGISLQMLGPAGAGRQLALDFDGRAARTTPVVDRIKSKYGEHAIGPARVLEAVRHPATTTPRPTFHPPPLRTDGE